jgi:hypothetical protein
MPSRSLKEAAASCADASNTIFVQADPATFRALVQKLTGAPPEEEVQLAPVPRRRPKLQERRRAGAPRLELARPHQQSFYYYHHHHGLAAQHSPVSPMDACYALAAASSSPSSSLSPSSPRGVVISKEDEEREEMAIASKAFYLHSSPRSAGERPKLLPLFPVHSPRSSFLAPPN